MGIDFSHCDAHWAYSGFHTFRTNLAKEIGINLENMLGFGGSFKWDNVQDDIVPLLNHSDCDGELSVEECKRVAPRLRELVSNWTLWPLDKGYDHEHALLLAEGMDSAVERGEPLRFI